MHNKFWKIVNLLLFAAVIGVGCKSGPSNSEAVKVFLESKDAYERLVTRRSEINNEVRRIDNSLTNADTTAITIVSNLLDDLDNVDQLLKQWYRDVPVVPGNEMGEKKVDPNLSAEEMLKQQMEFKEKIQYIDSRMTDMTTALETLKSIPVKPRERMTQ